MPVDGPTTVVARFERRRDVRVDPEGPECVVEVEDEEFREREGVGESLGGWGGGGEG